MSFSKLIESLKDGRVTPIPVDLIQGDPDQPRQHYDRARLNDLAADIAVNGVLQPITVRPLGKHFQIIMGERRLRAARTAKLTAIPCLLGSAADADDAPTLEHRLQQLAENHHRDDLSPMDLARFLCKLRDDFDLSATEIAAQLKRRGFRDMGRSYVVNTMRLTQLPKAYQDQIADGSMPAGFGKYILQLPAYEGVQAAFAEKLDLCAREAAEEGYRVVSADVRRAVVDAIGAVGINFADLPLDLIQEAIREGFDWYDAHRPAFDVATVCAGCEHYKALTVDGEKVSFCMHPPAFREKHRAALAADKAAEKQATSAGTPRDAAEREAAVRDKVAEHLVEWLRGRVQAAIVADPIVAHRFTLWAAAGFACGAVDWQDGPTLLTWPRDLIRVQAHAEEIAVRAGYADPFLLTDDRDYFEAALVPLLLPKLNEDQVWRWALVLGIGLDGYSIVEGYLDCLDKAGLSNLGKEFGLGTPFTWPRPKLVEAITAGAPAGRVPERVQSVFDECANEQRAAYDAYRLACTQRSLDQAAE